MNEDENKVCMQREAECEAESYLLNKHLKRLGHANWITVLIPSLLSVTASSALFVTEEKWKIMTAALILTAALLTAVHRSLNCDAHQIECRRLIQAYDSLQTRYRTLYEISKDNWLDDFLALENQLAELREGATVKLTANQS